MKKLLTFALLLALLVTGTPSVFAEDGTTPPSADVTTTSATGATGGTGASGTTGASTSGSSATGAGASTTGAPLEMEVKIQTESDIQTVTITPIQAVGTDTGAKMCGGKPMPALECPSGYAVGCNPTGGERWSCLKSPGAPGATQTGASTGARPTNYLDQDDDNDSVPTILEDDAVQSAIYIKIGDIKGEMEGAAKGNVDFGWKVEEGESAAGTDVFLKFPPIDGDSGEAQSAPKEIMINAVLVRGWDPKTKQEIADTAPKTADEVKTEAGLALFAAVHVENDAQMESVSFNYEKITFKYSGSGKLFGFIPHKFTQEVSLEDSAVSVKQPWYAFVLSGQVTADDLATEAKKKEKPIQIESWSFGASNASSMSSGSGGGSGKVKVAVGDINGDGRASSPEDFAGAFSVLSDAMKASYDLKANKKI